MPKAFLDTNLFVYANDRRDPAKQKLAISVVTEAIEQSSGVVSTQVLMEYAAVAIGKLRQERGAIARQLLLMERLEVLPIRGEIVRSALELTAAYSLSFWDAAIVAAAQASHCDLLLSEDLAHGASYGPVKVRNPFRGAMPGAVQSGGEAAV